MHICLMTSLPVQMVLVCAHENISRKDRSNTFYCFYFLPPLTKLSLLNSNTPMLDNNFPWPLTFSQPQYITAVGKSEIKSYFQAIKEEPKG